jgi:FlaA1/EpsC-like NDP-sugar epimerase
MMKRIRNRHFLIGDIIWLALASYASFVLRLETLNLGQYWLGWAAFTGLILLITPAVFYVNRLYTHYWRYASVEELLLLAGSMTISTAIAGGLVLLEFWMMGGNVAIPRSTPLIFLLLAVTATAGQRFLVRLERRYEKRTATKQHKLNNALVLGAGNTGALMIREVQQNSDSDIKVVGILDDDTSKLNARIHNVPVLGPIDSLAEMVEQHNVKQIIIAMPNASGKRVREILHTCEEVGVQTKIMPGVHEVLGGKVNVSRLRDVQIEDLLRREPIQTDVTAVGDLIRGKRVLVTGGGGSIGSELCRQALAFEPAELIILGHGENSIFTVHNELKTKLAKDAARAKQVGGSDVPTTRLEPVVADIRFPDRIQAVLEDYEPDIIFHAAAHKHVPLMQHNPVEAVGNNVLGTMNLLDAARSVGVEHFVMISTDKAVNPTSIMGTTKRAAELLVHQAAEATGKPYVVVRFGNVLGSRGSVVLNFKEQIARGGPVTVTHPEMERFFMTIPEAVQLTLQAATIGRGGEVFTLDMGEPVKIVDLARDMIELSGLEVGRDIDIEFTGTRPGEKLYEELFIPGETYKRTRHEQIFIANNASSFVPQDLDEEIYALEVAAQQHDIEAVLESLQYLVPQMRIAEESRPQPRVQRTVKPMLTPMPPLTETPPNGSSGRMHELPEQPLKVRAVGG